MFSPATVLGIEIIFTFSLDPVGKILMSSSPLPDAAVDCKEFMLADPVEFRDPVRKLE